MSDGLGLGLGLIPGSPATTATVASGPAFQDLTLDNYTIAESIGPETLVANILGGLGGDYQIQLMSQSNDWFFAEENILYTGVTQVDFETNASPTITFREYSVLDPGAPSDPTLPYHDTIITITVTDVAESTTTAWISASSGASIAVTGDSPAPGSNPSWTGPGNITASDDSYAGRSAKGTTNTNTLRALFDFSAAVPPGATIIGVELGVEKAGSGWNDVLVQLISADTPATSDRIGSNKATGDAWPATDAEVLYGGAADLWGATLTDTIVRSATFGVDLRANKTSGAGTVDHVRMRVTYA